MTVKIIWTCDDWESDWIKDVLLKDISYDLVFDKTFETVSPNCIIVHNCGNRASVEMLNKAIEKIDNK